MRVEARPPFEGEWHVVQGGDAALVNHDGAVTLGRTPFTREARSVPETTDPRVTPDARLVLPEAVLDASRARDLYRRHARTPRTVDDFLADRRAESEADGDGLGAGSAAERETGTGSGAA